jgi:hypothetical protein
MHGGRIADIADLPCSDQDAVNKLGVLTWNAIALMANKSADPRPEIPLSFGVPDHFVRRKLVANVHMKLGYPGDPDNPKIADFPEVNFEAKYVRTEAPFEAVRPAGP